MNARERLSDYLLDELSDDERERFEAELARDPALAAEAERLRPVVTQLSELEPAAWEPGGIEVPPLELPGIPAPPAPARTPWWRRPVTLRPAAAGALAAALLALGVLGGVLVGGGDDATTGGRVLALAPVEPLGGRATGSATLAGDRATISLAGLAPSANGEFYELWLLNSADDLVALGSFTVSASGEADISVPVPGDPENFAALDISVEPSDGDPAHSTRSVLRAPLADS